MIRAVLMIALALVLAPLLAMSAMLLNPTMPVLLKRACWIAAVTAIYVVSLLAFRMYFLRGVSVEVKSHAQRIFKVCSILLGALIAVLWILMFVI